MEHSINKQMLAAFKILADNLRPVNNETSEIHRLKGSDIIEFDNITEMDGVKIDPEQYYMMRYPVMIFSNHYRRLKNAWKKRGREGVQDYLRYVHDLVIDHEKFKC